MSSDAIYLVSDSGELQRVEHQFYATEDVLQQLVAKHPELIAGGSIICSSISSAFQLWGFHPGSASEFRSCHGECVFCRR